MALLVCALFLQRFSLPYQNTALELDLVVAVLIMTHQFLSGKLVIQLDRLFWFVAVAIAVSFSLLLNFKSTMLTSHGLFLVLYSLVVLNKQPTPEQYKSTLRAFQFLIFILSVLAVAQFAAQFVINGKQLIMFYGLVPDILFPEDPLARGANPIHEIGVGSLIRSNGLFLAEPSNLSQVTALGILIEVQEFRRPRYLFIIALGFLTAYSGLGMVVLLLFLPLAALRDSRAALSVVFVVLCAIGVSAAGLIEPSVFLSRVDEFQQTSSSGFARFVAPFWVSSIYLDAASLQALLVGNGPGTTKYVIVSRWWAASPGWLKLLYEYGIIGSFLFICFCASCLIRSRCPRLLLAELIFLEIIAMSFLTTWFLIIMIVLCTLQGAGHRRARVNAVTGYPWPSSPVPASVPQVSKAERT